MLVGVEVKVGVGVLVLTGVLVAVGAVPVGVGVSVPHGGCIQMSITPLVGPAVLHIYCVNSVPVLCCTPMVALERSAMGVPYTKSMRLWFS